MKHRLAGAFAAAIGLLLAPFSAHAADQVPLKQTGAPPHPTTFSTGDTVGVAHGGDGVTVLTAHCVVIGQGTSPVHLACPSVSGQVLTDNGASADPTFQAAATPVSITAGNAGIVVSPSPLTGTGTISLNLVAAAVSHEWVASCTTAGVCTFSQPGFGDISGSITLAQLPSIADGTILANISGSSAVPAADTLTAILDHIIGSTQGMMMCRGASSWGALSAGTNTYVLTSGGTSVCPSWGAPGTPTIPNPLYIPTGGTTGVWVVSTPPTGSTPGDGSIALDNADSTDYVNGVPLTSQTITFTQNGAASGTSGAYSVVLGAAPTAGDVEVASASNNGCSAASPASGWTAITTTGTPTGGWTVAVAWHLVGSGESATQTPFSGTMCSGGTGLSLAEFSNVDPQFTYSFESAVVGGTGAGAVTLTATTSHANDYAIALGGVGKAIGGTTSLTGSSWANVVYGGGANGNPVGPTGTLSVATSGSTVTDTVSDSGGVYAVAGALVILEPVPLNFMGWRPLSILTHIQAAGSDIDTNPFKLNFTNAFSLTDDQNGKVTVDLAMSQALDNYFGTTQGSLICRGASTWGVIAAATSGDVLTSNGPSLCPSWATASGGSSLPVGSAPTMRGTATLGQTTGTSLSLNWPTGTVSTDFAVLTCSGGNTTNAPSGWTTFQFFQSGFWSTFIFTKTLNSTDISTGHVTVTFAAGFQQDCYVATFATGAAIAAINDHTEPIEGGTSTGNNGPMSVAVGPGSFSVNTFYLNWASARINATQSATGTINGSAMTNTNGSASLYTKTFGAAIDGLPFPIIEFSNGGVANGVGDLALGILNP